jgi:hypothetical protein
VLFFFPAYRSSPVLRIKAQEGHVSKKSRDILTKKLQEISKNLETVHATPLCKSSHGYLELLQEIGDWGSIQGCLWGSAPTQLPPISRQIPCQPIISGHLPPQSCLQHQTRYRRTSISGTTFSGKKCLSGIIFHAIWLDFSMQFDNLSWEKCLSGKVICALYCPAYRSFPVQPKFDKRDSLVREIAY